MERARHLLEEYELPGRDLYDLPTSPDTLEGARLKVKYCQIMRELVGRLNPKLLMSDWGPSDLRLAALSAQAK